MRCLERLQRYLNTEGVAFRATVHRTAYTAQQVAQVEHLPGKVVAKVVVATGEKGPCLLVLPATHRIDLERAAAALGAVSLRLATEAEFAPLFPDCEAGAMPPFGNLYGLPVYVDESLTSDPEITFPAGTHQLSLTVAFADFARLAQPAPVSFAVHV